MSDETKAIDPAMITAGNLAWALLEGAVMVPPEAMEGLREQYSQQHIDADARLPFDCLHEWLDHSSVEKLGRLPKHPIICIRCGLEKDFVEEHVRRRDAAEERARHRETAHAKGDFYPFLRAEIIPIPLDPMEEIRKMVSSERGSA